MRIDVVRPQDLSAAQVERWGGLQGAGLESPFLSPHWAKAVERAQPSRQVRVAVFSDDGGERGFFPARIGASVAMPAGAPMCDYQGVVGEPGLAVEPKALVQAFGAGRLDFTQMLAGQSAFAPYARGRSVSHIVDVGAGFAAYEAERRAAGVGVLKDAAKKRRKAAREAGEARFTAFSRSRRDFDQLIAWKRAQLRATNQTDIFDASWTLNLLDDLFDSRDPDFGGALFTLHFGDRLAAAHFHLRNTKIVHGWMIAHDHAFERYSPGILLFVDILAWMNRTTYGRLDLGCGDYRFKLELANAQEPIVHGFVGRASAAALVREATYGVVRAAEALPLGRISFLPAKAMRRLDRWRGLR
jgi:CelD/BcsL family acetyltransferase involved in cellulose biosynthesis